MKPIKRPRGSKNKTIKPGMKIIIMPICEIQARYRVKRGQQILGYVIGHGSIDTSKGDVYHPSLMNIK